MGAFDNAIMVKINNKEVDSIKTNDGGMIYQRPVNVVVTGNSITLGKTLSNWLKTNGNVVINWGDGASNTVNNPQPPLTHTYTDNKSNHTITFVGIVTQLQGTFESSNITSAVIPDGVTNLKQNCFYNCTNLASIVIPNSVTSFENTCFYHCNNLTNITIPSNVTTIGNYCFYGCTTLVNYQLYWTGNNIITYDSNKMPNNTNTKFYVPKGQKTNYVNKGYPSAKVIERS